MKIAHYIMVIGLAGAAGCQSAHAEQTPDPSKARVSSSALSGTASAITSASLPPLEAEPKTEGSRKPWVPSVDIAFPEGSSAPPTKEEWAAAKDATEARITAPDCKARRVREWYRIDCSNARWIDSMAGGREGVSFGCVKSIPDDDAVCDTTWVVFPMRRGDRRAFELFSWSKYGPSPDSIATAYFLESDALPSISIQGLRGGI